MDIYTVYLYIITIIHIFYCLIDKAKFGATHRYCMIFIHFSSDLLSFLVFLPLRYYVVRLLSLNLQRKNKETT